MPMELTLFEMLVTAALGFLLGWAVANVFRWPLARGLAGLSLAVLAGMLIGVRPNVASIGCLTMAAGYVALRIQARPKRHAMPRRRGSNIAIS